MSEPSGTTIEQQISAIIDEHVRPYIEMDGGSIEFTRYEHNVVYVRLSGACNTCPSSSLTLKGGVERQIRRRLPEVISVEMEGSTSMTDGEPVGTTVLRY
ncbi:MAG TPA: NifU family protein [Candidatus Kapabacteria bacterium]|jgi:Fe-S cluster biogenesis protein NfuA|nr:NifU family protein [Candidatus Kapabacteria bacterium]